MSVETAEEIFRVNEICFWISRVNCLNARVSWSNIREDTAMIRTE
jgi:hypothetical protein